MCTVCMGTEWNTDALANWMLCRSSAAVAERKLGVHAADDSSVRALHTLEAYTLRYYVCLRPL